MPAEGTWTGIIARRTGRFLLTATKIILAFIALALIAGYSYERYAISRDLGQMPPPGQISTVGGLDLHIYCLGSGRPSIVLATGAGTWSAHWNHVQRAISQRARICLYDRAGLGWSKRPPKSLTVQQQVQNLHELLAAAGEHPPYVLAGHSLGGYLARIYADKYPDEVAGVILIDSAHEDQWEEFPAELSAMMPTTIAQLKMAVWMARFGFFRVTGVPPQGLPTPDQERQVQAFTKTAAFFATARDEFEAGFTTLPQAVKEADSLQHVPLLVITAGKSANSYCALNGEPGPDCTETQLVWDRLQRDLLTLSTASRQVVLPRSSHAVYIDEPKRVAELILEFVTSL